MGRRQRRRCSHGPRHAGAEKALLILSLAAAPAHALSPAAQEFMSITKELEPVQCEKRQLRREMARAEIEQRQDDLKKLRAKFTALDKDKKVARLEQRLAELEPRVSRSSDPDDLPAISRQQREAFYRCD
jgi:predicted nuclease with TOPRIM domain